MHTYAGTMLALAAVIGLTAVPGAGQISIPISGLVNEPWTFAGNGAGILNGGTFPTGMQTFGGIPFDIPSGPNNYWNGAAAGDFGPGVYQLNVPVGIYGVTSVFTLINSLWGQFGPSSYIYVTFSGSAGASVTMPLIGNVNVRDYNNDGGDNAINNTSTVQAWTNGIGQRLDRQEYVLPPEFASQVLTNMAITDTGGPDFSRAVFSAVTASTCHTFVTDLLTATAGQIIYKPGQQAYLQTIALRNNGATAVKGPIFFELVDLPAAVTLVNPSQVATCFDAGSRYLVPLMAGTSLAPNTTLLVHLSFRDPTAAAITYTPLVLGSLGGAP